MSRYQYKEIAPGTGLYVTLDRKEEGVYYKPIGRYRVVEIAPDLFTVVQKQGPHPVRIIRSADRDTLPGTSRRRVAAKRRTPRHFYRTK